MQKEATIDGIDLAKEGSDRTIVTEYADGRVTKIVADSDATDDGQGLVERVEESLKKNEPIKVSRHQRRKNKSHRTRIMRKIAKKVKAVKSCRTD